MNSIIFNKEFYKGKKILVTGHTGFKGAWLSELLNYYEADVLGYSLEEEDGCLYQKIRNRLNVKNVYGDIRDYEQLKKTIDGFQPEIVFHLAAFGFIKECFDNPIKSYSTNVMGTVMLLDALRDCKSVKSIVVVTTDKVYENHGDGAVYSEADKLGGIGPYSSSKTCCELVVNDYKETYLQTGNTNIGVATVRASNVLGGGDHIESRLIPSILRAIEKGEEVLLRHPEQTRPWQSVLDALNGYMTVARKLYNDPQRYSCAWNIGPTEDGIRSVGWMYNKMKEYFSNIESKCVLENGITESKTLGLDITKSVEMLEWKPYLTIEETIEMLVSFFKEKRCGIDEHEICVKQIKYYLSKSASS